MKSYIMGQGKMPGWVSDRVMCFRKADGSTGYELDTGWRFTEIYEGDKIIQNGKYLKIIRLPQSAELTAPSKKEPEEEKM